MKKTRKLVIEIIDNIVYMVVFYGFAAIFLYALTRNTQSLLHLTAIVLPFSWHFILRRLIKSFWISLPVHFIFPAVALLVFLGTTDTMFSTAWVFLEFMVWAAAVVIPVLYSLSHYFRPEPSGWGFGGFAGVAFIVMSFVAAHQGIWVFLIIYPALLVIVIIGQVIVSHMVGMDTSLDAVQLSSAQPVRQIISFNYKLVSGLGVVLAALTLILFFALVSPVLTMIANNFQFGGFSLRPIEIEPPTPAAHDPLPMAFPPEYLLPFEYAEPSRFAEILGVVFDVIAIVGIAVLVILGIIGLYRAIVNSLNRRRLTPVNDAVIQDEKEFIFPTINILSPKDQKSEHPIRRQFRKTVARHMKKGVPVKKTDTPTDITKRIKSEDITALTQDYSQVRYGTNTSH